MVELYKLMKLLGKISMIVVLISIIIFIGIVLVANQYAEAQQKNQNCDNSSYLLSNYTTNLSKIVGNASFPLIYNGKR